MPPPFRQNVVRPTAEPVTVPPAANAATVPDAIPPAASSAPKQVGSDAEVTEALVQINTLLDAYFDFNAYLLRPDAMEAVTGAAAVLKQHLAADPTIRLVVEGHCDERGSSEFNLALGDRRAESVRDLLSQLGVAAQRMRTISYGEAKPDCVDSTESCWQKNRRAHIRHER